MRDLTSEELAAYAARTIITRDLIFVTPKDFSTGDLTNFGFWNGTGDVSLDVIDGITQVTTTRNFTARGAVLDVADIQITDSLQAVSATVTLSQLNSDVENAIRGYDMRGAPIQIYRALFDTANPRALVKPARCRYAGFVNTAPMATPPIGGAAALTLNCVGCTVELTRSNTDLRSDESQQRRYAGDRFFRWVGVTGQVKIFWGQNSS